MNSYPKVYTLGHRAIQGIFHGPVIVEEKIDGSQFSFGCYPVAINVCEHDTAFGMRELRCRSKSAELNLLAPEKMFKPAVLTAYQLFPLLKTGWTYRCEYLAKPKHNTLVYDRVPAQHLILFDIMGPDPESYLNYDEVSKEADRLGLECVPLLYTGRIDSPEMLRSFLDTTSILGGQKIEGVVVKNYNRFTADTGKPMIGKFVSEAFKEAHGSDWKERNPHGKDIIEILRASYVSAARWQKAVQHLREAGLLTDSPVDIGPLIGEVCRDVHSEEVDTIKDALFKWAWPQISRGLTRGLPEWYKEQLLTLSFEKEETSD